MKSIPSVVLSVALAIAAASTPCLSSMETEVLADDHVSLAFKNLEAEQNLEGSGARYAKQATHLLQSARYHMNAASGRGVDDDIERVQRLLDDAYARHLDRGSNALAAKDPHLAVRDLRLAAVANPENYQSYYLRSSAHWELARLAQYTDPATFRGEVAEAIVNLQRAIYAGVDETTVLVKIHHAMGDMQDKLGNYKEAVVAYKDAIALEPSDEFGRRRLREIRAKETR